MTATVVSRAEWQQLRVPRGTAARPMEGGSPTMKGEGAELTYARRFVAGPALSDTLSARAGDPVAAPAVIVLPTQATPRQKFIPLSRREGVVLEIRGDEFDARLVDLDSEEGDLDATFAIEELSPDDIPLLRVGAVFYWTIGYFDDQVGRRTRVSDLRFRRLPAEDPKEVAESEAEAYQIRRDLGLE